MSNVMKSIQGVKVSDVFDLTKVSFPYSYTDQQVRVAGRAIANYDRMVEEIAELKGLVDSLKKDRSSAISLMSKSWQHGAEDRPMILTSFVEMANKQFESLAKLNQEGEE